MEKQQFQSSLFDHQVQVLDLADADIEYYPEFINPESGWAYLDALITDVDWHQERIDLYGKSHAVPRLSCWMGDAGSDYAYSGIKLRPVVWSDTIIEILNKVQTKTGYSFNSVLLNYYRNGQDSVGWHSDDEPELATNPAIASLSLGASRVFQLRHKTQKTLRQSLTLDHGSLLIMQGRTQHCWQHQLPKRAHAEARINLTFRTIKTIKATC